MQKTIAYLQEELSRYYPETEISAFARLILPHLTGKRYSYLLADEKLEIQTGELDKIIDRLKTYEPIQYILGDTEFFGLSFYVNKNTLIPRPETEELVELIIGQNKLPEPYILDIGTGSGCIAISIAKHIIGSRVHAWDFSQGALDVASRNATHNSVRISFSQIDIFNNILPNDKFDIIVSNPPYVMESEKKDMHPNVLNYEPHSALFVADNKALIFYDRIADIALRKLNRNGKLYFEINQAKGQETISMLEEKGFSNIQIIKDISKLDRIVVAELDN